MLNDPVTDVPPRDAGLVIHGAWKRGRVEGAQIDPKLGLVMGLKRACFGSPPSPHDERFSQVWTEPPKQPSAERLTLKPCREALAQRRPNNPMDRDFIFRDAESVLWTSPLQLLARD